MNRNMLLILTMATVIGLTSAGWATPEPAFVDNWDDGTYVKDEQIITEDLGGISTVALRNVNGSITAELGQSDSMELTVHEKVKETSKIDAQALLAEARVVARREGDHLIVEIDYGRFSDNKYRGYYQSNYTVVLPRRLNVQFESTNGSITAPMFDGTVDLETTNGSIKSKGAGGLATLETTNGSIHIDAVGGTVKARTTNGNIKLSRVNGSVTAETTNGNIEVDLAGSLAGDVTLETTNGSIVFNPGPGSSYELEADTSWGKIHGVEGMNTNKRRTYASGTVGSGQYKVRLETTNGSIRIQR